jgi:hypothetical protein
MNILSNHITFRGERSWVYLPILLELYYIFRINVMSLSHYTSRFLSHLKKKCYEFVSLYFSNHITFWKEKNMSLSPYTSQIMLRFWNEGYEFISLHFSNNITFREERLWVYLPMVLENNSEVLHDDIIWKCHSDIFRIRWLMIELCL